MVTVFTAVLSDLCSGGAARCGIMQEDSEYMRHNVWQIKFKVCAESTDDLLQKQDDCVL